MFSVAGLLDRAKAKANIESDYRLAKVLRITQSAVSNWRMGRNLPTIEIIESLCALSGDDAALMVALAEAERAKEGPVKRMWEGMAARLSGGASPAILAIAFAIFFIAAAPGVAEADDAVTYVYTQPNNLYIV